MVKRSKLDFDDTPESTPDTAPSVSSPAAQLPDKPTTGVICQRCQVACDPVAKSRGWVRCPKCGWKHKSFDKLAAAKQALRGKQSRASR
jgi:hypothetical protein